MSATLGRVTAQLELPTDPENNGLVRLINDNVNPPSRVRADDVHIRTLYIVSDEVNSYGGCFPANEHRRIAELLVDSPVMIGHRKDRLPIGRNFHATVVRRGGRSWVKSYFYWLKTARGAESLRENIDGGIYKECSIAFTYGLPECSVCGRDIRVCPHEPSSPRSGRKSCHFNYRQIERVLETSLVYRGAVPNTRVAKELKEEHTPSPIIPKIPDKELTIHFDPDSDRAFLMVNQGDLTLALQLRQFNPARFKQGIRFVADSCKETDENITGIRRLPVALSSPHLSVTQADNDRITCDLDADWASRLIIERLRVDGRNRFIVYVNGTGK